MKSNIIIRTIKIAAIVINIKINVGFPFSNSTSFISSCSSSFSSFSRLFPIFSESFTSSSLSSGLISSGFSCSLGRVSGFSLLFTGFWLEAVLLPALPPPLFELPWSPPWEPPWFPPWLPPWFPEFPPWLSPGSSGFWVFPPWFPLVSLIVILPDTAEITNASVASETLISFRETVVSFKLAFSLTLKVILNIVSSLFVVPFFSIINFPLLGL